VKKWFLQLPIKQKLNAIILLVCFVILLLSSAVSFINQWHLYQQKVQEEIQKRSDIEMTYNNWTGVSLIILVLKHVVL